MEKQARAEADLQLEIEALRLRNTELQNTIDDLCKSSKQLADIINSLPDAALVINNDGQVIVWNRTMEKMTGIQAEEMLGKNDYEYAIPFYGKKRPLLIDLVLRNDPSRLEDMSQHYTNINKEGDILRGEAYTPALEKGKSAHLHATASLLRNSEGEVIGAIECFRDNTGRKELEEKLIHSERQYRNLVDNSPVGVFMTNLSGLILFINQAFAETLSYDSAEELFLLNSKISYRRHEDRERITDILYSDGVLNQCEVELLTKDGESRYVLMSAVLEQGLISGTIMDITSRKRTIKDNEKLQAQLMRAQKMEAIGTLAGGVAHDFNNLLMGIQGYASLSLLAMAPDHPCCSNLQKIEELVASGAGLTRQLLGFALGGKYEARPTNINMLLEKTLSIFSRTNKEITIDMNQQDFVWTVDVDRGQMEQVFLNIFINAGQAMPDGGNLYIETGNLHQSEPEVVPYGASPGSYVCVAITDTGIGMDEKTLERIFDPFFTTKSSRRGTGLGLASAYGIVKRHGGYIRVNSQPGVGSTFRIHLPASDNDVPLNDEVAEVLLTGRETVLVVDDEKDVACVTKEMLKILGYRTFIVGSGQEAVAAYMERQKIIDLVILDMIMPGMSGAKTFEALRKINHAVKVILASGFSMDEQTKQLLESGCKGFIQKPFGMPELSRKVREVLDAGKR